MGPGWPIVLHWESRISMRNDPIIPASEVREYAFGKAAIFWTTKGPFGALSNMARGYPVTVNGVIIPTVEALYQAMKFSDAPHLQAEIIQTGNAWLAKRKAMSFEPYICPDWARVRVRIMRWCLRLKVGHHPARFGGVLLSTEDLPIVERSTKDAFWGARAQGQERLVGVNVLGRLLMELREELKNGGASRFHILDAPDIPGLKLMGNLVGRSECEPEEAHSESMVPWVINSNQGV